MIPSIDNVLEFVGERRDPLTLWADMRKQFGCSFDEAVEAMQRAIERDWITIDGQGYLIPGSYQWA